MQNTHDIHDSIICQLVLEGTLLDTEWTNFYLGLSPPGRQVVVRLWPFLPPHLGTLSPDLFPNPNPAF